MEKARESNWFRTGIESYNHLGCKRPSRSLSPTVNLTYRVPSLNHVPKCYVHTSLKNLQEWRLCHLPWQLFLMLAQQLHEKNHPNIQSKPLLVHLEIISSCPTTCHLRKETDTLLAAACFQVVVMQVAGSPLFCEFL